MTRNDYKLVAAVLAEASNQQDVYHPELVIAKIADAFARENPNFNRQRFINAAWGEKP